MNNQILRYAILAQPCAHWVDVIAAAAALEIWTRLRPGTLAKRRSTSTSETKPVRRHEGALRIAHARKVGSGVDDTSKDLVMPSLDWVPNRGVYRVSLLLT